MTERQRATPPTNSVRLAVAGAIVAGGALVMAGQAGADPEVLYPTPVPSGPDVPAPVPGQPVVESADALAAPPAPPPVGAPLVPEIQNPVYGEGKSSGPLGFLRDAWHQAQDPYGFTGSGSPDQLPPAAPPPPGAAAPPPLPPGYISLNAPGSETASVPKGPEQGGPPLPPGYYPLNGPPPPGYSDPVPPDPAVPPTVVPIPPTP
jgi:hypothetical protein